MIVCMDFDGYQFYLNTNVVYRIHSLSVVESEENNPWVSIAPRQRAKTDGKNKTETCREIVVTTSTLRFHELLNC